MWRFLVGKRGETMIPYIIGTLILTGVAFAVSAALKGGILTMHSGAIATMNNLMSGGF